MFARAGQFIFHHVLLLALAGLVGSPALAVDQKGATPPTKTSAAASASRYVVQRSELAIPDGVAIGQYRRITHPFPNWTLLCDENLKAKQKVCNIVQTIVRTDGDAAFSWSLAATENGQPFFILRVPPNLGTGGAITLDPQDGKALLTVPVKGCDSRVCVAYQPVGPRLRAAIDKGAIVELSYSLGSPSETVKFQAPLAGLKAALASI